MNEIERAIKTIKHISDLDTKHHLNISNYDLLTAIEALREKAERKKGCEWCNTLIYMRVQRYTLPAMAPLTHADELEHELINITGKDYVPAEKRYCHVCGRKLRED